MKKCISFPGPHIFIYGFTYLLGFRVLRFTRLARRGAAKGHFFSLKTDFVADFS